MHNNQRPARVSIIRRMVDTKCTVCKVLSDMLGPARGSVASSYGLLELRHRRAGRSVEIHR